MAASSNAQLNAWADNRARVIADKLTQLRYAVDAYLTDYAADGIAALISSDGASNLMGTQDSRIPISGTQILNLKAALLQVQVAMETTAVSGVGTTVAAVCDAIQVNGSPR
jgi:hypothetical protein